MALTEKQIEELFRFCEKKFVRQYDLQLELVDHLAERIEEEMATDSRLSFEEALQKVYKGFGIFGFAHIVQDRAAMLEKRNSKLWWSQVKTFVVLPRILLTLSLGLLFYQLAAFINEEICTIVLCTTWLGGFICQAHTLLRLRKSMHKNLMLTQNLSAATSFTPFFLIQFLFDSRISTQPVVFAVLMVFGIIYHVAFVVVVKNISEEARKLYPQAFKTA